MKIRRINESFTCGHCNREVAALKRGTCRNHCPFCLYSKHVDADLPGDRQSACRGLMEPVQIKVHSKKQYQILHRCMKCGKEQWNKVAPDDDFEMLVELPLPNPLPEGEGRV